MRRKFEKDQIWKLAIAIVLATIALSFIFITVNSVTYIDYINSKQQTNAISEAVSYMQQSGRGINCSSNFFESTSGTLDSIAKDMNILEAQWGANDPRVLEEKKLYSQLEEDHLKIVLRLNKECNDNFLPIIFFYSNQKNETDASQTVSFILSSFRQDNLGKVMVYSFDYNLNSSAVGEMINKYGITNAPSIAIGKNWTVFTPTNINQLDPYLSQ